MNTEFITNGDDDEVHVPKEGVTFMSTEKEKVFFEWWFGAKAYEEFNKAFEEEAKKLIIEKPTSNKEYSDKMKKYLEERNKK